MSSSAVGRGFGRSSLPKNVKSVFAGWVALSGRSVRGVSPNSLVLALIFSLFARHDAISTSALC
jgi:hypothetical protein